jgi:hypothetical protein
MPARPDGAAVEKARRDVEDCMARRALGEANEADAVEEEAAHARLRVAENELASIGAERARKSLAFGGLNRRFSAAQEDEAAAQKAFDELQLNWLFEELTTADDVYTKQAMVLEQHYRRVFLVADSLRRRGVTLSHAITLADDFDIPTVASYSRSNFLTVVLTITQYRFDPYS